MNALQKHLASAARKRWANKSVEERRAHALKMVAARKKKDADVTPSPSDTSKPSQ